MWTGFNGDTSAVMPQLTLDTIAKYYFMPLHPLEVV